MTHVVHNPPLKNWFRNTTEWVKADFKSWPLRFCLEMIAWAISIGCSITYAIMVPNLPFITLYCLFITGCSIYAWCAWTRGSFGMLANYMLLTTIDSMGLIKLLFFT